MVEVEGGAAQGDTHRMDLSWVDDGLDDARTKDEVEDEVRYDGDPGGVGMG